jgi:hypothetical protein
VERIQKREGGWGTGWDNRNYVNGNKALSNGLPVGRPDIAVPAAANEKGRQQPAFLSS